MNKFKLVLDLLKNAHRYIFNLGLLPSRKLTREPARYFMKIGYACINNQIKCTTNTTFKLASYSEKILIEKIENNLTLEFHNPERKGFLVREDDE